MPSQRFGFPRIVRYASVSLVGFALLVTSGCSIEEFLGGGWSVETDDAATATPTRVRSTPIPTNTPWTFVTATPTPLQTSTPTPTQPPTATPSPTPSPTPAPVLLPLLPTLDDMPDDFELTTEDASLTADEAAQGFDNPEQLAARFEALGYEAGAFREFMLPDPGVAAYLTELLGFQATVMQFDTAAHAGEAIAFQREFAKGQPDWDLNDKTVEQIADESAALTGTAVYEGVDVKVVVIFVRDGDLVYRFIAISGAYDAFKDTVWIARETVPA